MLPKKLITKNCKQVYCSIKKFYLLSSCMYALASCWLILSFIYEGQARIVVCPSKWIYHIPCPGCGLTRACLAVLHGHLLEGIVINPNCIIAFFLYITFPVLLLYDMMAHRTYCFELYNKIEKRISQKKIIIFILVIEGIVWWHNLCLKI